MPLKKLTLKAGVNRENTRYANENGWYESEKVRFRQGTPEKIGGWSRISANTYLGVCRSLWNWVTLTGSNLLGVGTNTKFYIESGGSYTDITPIRRTVALSNPFTATASSATITVADTGHGCVSGDYVTFSGAASLGGNITAAVLNQEYQVTVTSANAYTFTATATANGSDTGKGGTGVVAQYQINTGSVIEAKSGTIFEVWATGDSKVIRSIYFIHLVDWASYYLCQLNKADIMDIGVIDYLKEALAKQH